MPPQLAALPDEPIPAIGYIRVSLAREEMISPEIQKAAISRWARQMGRRIVDWIIDLDQSGRNFRRKVMRGIERVEAREAAEIVAYRYDRWGRNAAESLANCYRVELVGGQVLSATEPFDVETAIGKYTRTNAFAIAEMQSDIIAENWKATLANRVERGLTTSGSNRFGYIRRGRVLDPYSDPKLPRYRRDPDDDGDERYEPDYVSGLADTYVQLYDLYLDHSSGFMTIAKWLNARGILNTRGAPWSDVTVRNVMDSGFAAGLLRVHDPECRCKNKSSCKRRIYVKGAHDTILEHETWERYLKTRAERGAKPPRSRYPKYPLTGLIYCQHCDNPMKIQSGGHPNVAGYGYRCSRWHHYRDCNGPFPRRSVVEREVKRELDNWAADIEANAAITTARKAARVTAEVDRQRLEAALERNDAALRRLAVQRAVDGDQMPDGIYDEARDQLLGSRAEIEAELKKVEKTEEANADEAYPIIRSLIDGWDLLPAMTRNGMLGKLVRHVKVSRPDGGTVPVLVDSVPVWEDCECKLCKRKAEDQFDV